MNPLISVIIPTYNREKLIVRSVKSIINQTYHNFEIIVVDDCSTDNTEMIVKNIGDKRIRYVKLKKNSGACAARNYGIEIAEGDYIAFQDSDDVWYPEKLEIQLSKMIDNNSLVSFCSFSKSLEGNKRNEILPIGLPEGEIDKKEILRRSVVSTQCLMAKSECFSSIKFDVSLPRLQDWDITIELSKKYKIYHIDNVLVNMFVQNDSISSHPERGVIALRILLNKNLKEIEADKEIRRMWHIYMGDYLVECHQSPSNEYKKALDVRFDTKTGLYYILSKLGILIPLKRCLGLI